MAKSIKYTAKPRYWRKEVHISEPLTKVFKEVSAKYISHIKQEFIWNDISILPNGKGSKV